MIGVLIMAYGGPNNLDEVEPYLLDVRGHRPTAPQIIHEVRERYREIGGRSPIRERTQAQANALQAALDAQVQGFKVYVGMRHWHPFIKDTLATMTDQRVRRAIGLVMTPHYSRMSVGSYYQRLEAVGSPVPIQFAPIQRWNLLPGYLDALTGRVQTALERFPTAERASVQVLFTAHSLPEKILTWNDPYPEELHATVEALTQRLNGQACAFAFQSAAISNEPWLGPDAGSVIARYAAQGVKNLLIAPIGFVCEHVEVLFDVDVIFKKQAEALGLRLERIEMLNTAPQMIDGLARLVYQTAQKENWL